MKNFYTLTILFLGAICNSQTIDILSFATGFTDPVEITQCGDSRLFVVQQNGTIKILNTNGTTNTTAFLNVSSLISTGGERGLLGLAFHPNYSTNGYFYINYTNISGNTVIARYSVSSSNINVANASSASILLTITQPFSNHNGGTLRFGSDGYLYIGMGDGGSAGDPGNRSQNKDLLLGKMLRLDVNNGTPYGIPPTNPYVGIAGADEIWAIGLRNPWKFSFDKNNGDLWIADVGQNEFEEINKTAPTISGLNYGWRCYEGNTAYNTTGCAPLSTMKMPIAVINHNIGSCSVTGGYVYRGTLYPNLQGKYLFTDFCNPKIGMVTSSGIVTYSQDFTNNNFSTFGEDINGELYIASINSGEIFKIIDTALGTNDYTKKEFKLFPNPTKFNFSVKTNNDNYPLDIVVYDISGKRIKNITVLNENQIINVNDVPSGLYIVNIQDFSGFRTNVKLTIL